MDDFTKQTSNIDVSNQDASDANLNENITPSAPPAKKLMYVGLFFTLFIIFLGGFYLGIQVDKEEPIVVDVPVAKESTDNFSQDDLVDGTTLTEEVTIGSLPSNWKYQSASECAVEFALPPKSTPYHIPLDPNKKQLSVTDDDGRFWDFPRGGVYPNILTKLPINYDQYHQAVSMFASEFEASGYIAYAVSVSCTPNIRGLDNQSLLSAVESGIDEFNQNTQEKGQEASAYTVLSAEETTRWGRSVLNLSVEQYYENPGGEPTSETVNYTIFATNEYIYEVRAFGYTENTFAIQTGQQIFENLKFEL